MLARQRVLEMARVRRPHAQHSSKPFCCTAMTSIVEQKKALRSRIRRELRLHYSSLSLTEDPIIQNHILEAPWYKSSRHICAYISCPSIKEVGTSQIISDILQTAHSDHPKALYVPWIEDKQSHLKFFHITSNQDLAANSMGILEPIPVDCNGTPREDVLQANEPVDVILMPGLGFDRAGGRLGRGGGYYDCFVKDYLQHAEKQGWRPPLLVGLAYSLQILDEVVPMDAKDLPIDALVSSSGVLPVSSHALLNEVECKACEKSPYNESKRERALCSAEATMQFNFNGCTVALIAK